MSRKSDVVATQIRIPAELHEYMKQESQKLNIPMNSFLNILLTFGREKWNRVSILDLDPNSQEQ